MDIATNIKKYRQMHHYTQKDFAHLLHVKPTTVSGWELGRNTPSIETLIRMSEILKELFKKERS